MSQAEGASPWPTPRPHWGSRILIAGLLLIIAVNETQRTLAQAAAHRERVEMKEMRTEMGWLLYRAEPGQPLPPQPTSTMRARPTPTPAGALPERSGP